MRELEQQSETAAHWAEREYDALFAPDAPKRLALIAGDDGIRRISHRTLRSGRMGA